MSFVGANSIFQQLSGSARTVYLLNLWTAITVLVAVLAVLAYRSTHYDAGPHQRFRMRALMLWGGWWLSLAVLYLMFCTAEIRWHGIALAVIDSGSISMLCFATAYTKGTVFHWRQTHTIAFGGLLLIVWDILTGEFYQNPTQRLIAIAPSAVLTTSWVISVGWAFYVRWGATAFPFLLLTIAYVTLQMPAYFYTFVVAPFSSTMPALASEFENLKFIYWWLFIGKIGYALMFFILFFSPRPFCPDMEVEQLAPPITPVQIYPKLKVVMNSLFLVFASVFSAAAASVFSKTIEIWLRHIGFPTAVGG
ncbi:hypothetical protein W02_40780 [Nitrospira sp. KM1]|uniref:hypothetical protein n=1 Tax=Nitrospira sp. KM1 TaxID=1936990 RepID=UPI0013A7332D|nr:hypothetical protein [Nitrospira sp. KM1]BCA56938.1 hypothetical protein W02_40780 [Nitrospira sp. KM1]